MSRSNAKHRLVLWTVALISLSAPDRGYGQSCSDLLSETADRCYPFQGDHLCVPPVGSQGSLSWKNQRPAFSEFILKKFNQPGDFHGINCYGTALVASGVYPASRLRYVSPEEFEYVLKASAIVVTGPNVGDLMVFDANHTRGHAALYLGDGLIFHKKSHFTHYSYRITAVADAGKVEEREWVPGFHDDPSAQMNWPELGATLVHYYRPGGGKPALDPMYGDLIETIETQLIQDLRKWAIGKNWGMMGEFLVNDLHSHLENGGKSYTSAVLSSLKEQLFTAIEETYFKSTRSTQSILRGLCLPENPEFLITLIHRVGERLGKSPASVDGLIDRMKKQDASTCKFRPFQELLKL